MGGVEVAVFANTNLGTRIAFNAHQDITAGALKRDFEKVHFRCLPDTGEIQVDGFMVKRKKSFYYLPDSLPIKHVFPEMRRTWFLHVEVRHSKCLCIPCSPHDAAILSKSQDMVTCNSENKAICNTEEKKMERFIENYMQNAANIMPEEEKTIGTAEKSQHLMEENKVENQVKLLANSIQGSLGETSTQVISVTGIINKYFSGFLVSKKSVVRKRRSHLVSKKSGDKKRGSKVGNRLLVASQSLGVSVINHNPTLSFCKFKDRNLVQYKSEIKGSIFSISDSDN